MRRFKNSPRSVFSHTLNLFRYSPFLDMNATYANFARQEGIEAHRWDFFPQLSYPMRLFDVFKIQPNAGFRETLYLPYNDPTGQLNDWKSREIFTAGRIRVLSFSESSKPENCRNSLAFIRWRNGCTPLNPL